MLIAPKEYLLQYLLSLLYTGNQLGEAIPLKTSKKKKKKVIKHRSTFTENDLQPYFVILWLDEVKIHPRG